MQKEKSYDKVSTTKKLKKAKPKQQKFISLQTQKRESFYKNRIFIRMSKDKVRKDFERENQKEKSNENIQKDMKNDRSKR